MTANHRPLEEGDIELIDRIRATPSLYDSRDPDFRLVHKKDQNWQMVAEGLAMSHWEARKRWTVLRDRYARELKQLMLHPNSMDFGKNEFFHRMDFLRNFVKKRRVRKKVYDSQGKEITPIKIAKVEKIEYDSAEQHQHYEKSYIIDDSQEEESNGNYTYVDQTSQDEQHQQEETHDQNLEEHEIEQDYQDYVEEAPETFEVISMEDDPHAHVESSHSAIPATTTVNPVGMHIKQLVESQKFTPSYTITTKYEPPSTTTALSPPELQQKPTLLPTSLPSTSSMPKMQQHTVVTQQSPPASTTTTQSSDQHEVEDYFSKTIASYLKQLSRRNKIKAKVEMMQILEKYIELEEEQKNL